MNTFDRRITPARPDLAAEHLRGSVQAARFVAGRPMRVIEPVIAMRPDPSPDAGIDTELLYGEEVTVYEDGEEGLSWVQAAADGYVGWVPTDALGPVLRATHRVALRRCFVFPGPSIKLPPLRALPFGARVAVSGAEGDFALIEGGGHLHAPALKPVSALEADFTAVAEGFLGTAYLWGGKSSIGLDCSALVQTGLHAAGIPCPRDSDMQAEALGTDIPVDGPFSRGDLVFWKGHVGIMRDPETLLHANAFHMATAAEPLAQARRRILAGGGGPILRAKRLPRPVRLDQ
jgi:hypothetical protein